MKINLSIIRIISICILFGSSSFAEVWMPPTDACQLAGCLGCKNIKKNIIQAANDIDDEHKKLEKEVKKKYEKDITGDEKVLDIIDQIQNDMAKVMVHIVALEEQANVDDKKLLFLLKKSQDLSTLSKVVD